MADSFINKLEESLTIKPSDFTVFDIIDETSGDFLTKKVRLTTITNSLAAGVLGNLQGTIDSLQASLNTVSQEIANKLDKRGYPYDTPNNKMNGALLVNAPLSVIQSSNFYSNVNLANNRIINLNDPISAFDGVNKRYVDGLISGLSIPSTANYLVKTGDAMTGGNLTLFNEPTVNKHATTKFYVDTNLNTLSSSLNSIINNNVTKYIPLSGGTMTGGFITAASDVPTDPRHLSTKKYVDDQIAGINIPTTGQFLNKSGDAMTAGYLTLFSEPSANKHAATKFYVDNGLSTLSSNLNLAINNNTANYIPLSGGTMTGGFITAASDVPTNPRHLSTKKYVDDKFVPLTGSVTVSGNLFFNQDYTTLNNTGNDLIFSTKRYVDNRISSVNTTLGTYLPLSGGTLTGPLVIQSFSEKVVSVTPAATTSIDLRSGNTFTIDLTLNITGGFTFTNLPTDSFSITLLITQKGSPACNITNWSVGGTAIKWENGNKPVISTTSNAIDLIVITKIGSNYFGFNGGQNFN